MHTKLLHYFWLFKLVADLTENSGEKKNHCCRSTKDDKCSKTMYL